MFDVTVQAVALGAEVAQDKTHQVLTVTVGLMLPVSPTEAVPIAAGKIRIPLGKDESNAAADLIAKNADELVKKSDLVTASDLSAVEKAAEQAQGFRDGPKR